MFLVYFSHYYNFIFEGEHWNLLYEIENIIKKKNSFLPAGLENEDRNKSKTIQKYLMSCEINNAFESCTFTIYTWMYLPFLFGTLE